MRAVEVMEFGGPEVLVVTEKPEPVAGPDQVVVDVSYADVLHLDTGLRAGRGVEFFGVKPPFVPGGGVAGTVVDAGEGVDDDWLGRQVVALTGGSGGYAERAAVDVAQTVAVPDGLELRQAAALMHDGRTAFALMESTGVRPGEWVLVVAAGGGLGLLIVQLARAAGGRVMAASGQRKLKVTRDHGAEHVIDYEEPGWTTQVVEVTGGAGPDVIFDGAGGHLGAEALDVLATGGRFSAHGAAAGEFTVIDPDEARRRRITFRGIEQAQLAPEDGRRLTRSVMARAAAGGLRPSIGQIWPLEEAADAHAAIAARTAIGKTLLDVRASRV